MKTKKRIEIESFNNFDFNSNGVKAKQFYNYFPTKILNNSSGIKNATFKNGETDLGEYELNIGALNIDVEGLAYFKQYFESANRTTHRLLVYGSDKKVYINQMLSNSNDLFWLYNLTFNTPPIALAYKNSNDNDAIILASKDEMKIWETGYSPYTVSGVPIITSMCMNEGILFCTIQNPAFKVWYATDLDAESIGSISSNSGYISLEDELGYSRKVITFNQSVFVFRDYGISKIDYVKGNISVSQVYLSNTKINIDTVAVCGNIILFLTKDGIYYFNGVKVQKLDVELKNLNFSCNNSVASSLGNKYYVALKLDFDDDKQILCEADNHVNNAILILDVNDYSYEIIRGVDVKNFLAVKTEQFEKMLLIFNSQHKNKVGEIVTESVCINEILPKYWCSKDLVQGNDIKLFTSLNVIADEGVKFSLKYDNKETSFTTYKKGLNQFAFKISCAQIMLEISSTCASSVVEKVYLDYYEY